MNTEIELKFRAPRRKLASLVSARVAGAKKSGSASHLLSTYYDTPKHKLRRHGLTLRVRRAGGEWVSREHCENQG
jgi:inorganic triphosphatase YgiF